MTTAIEVNRILIIPGHSILLTDVTWNEFESILLDLGEHRASQLTFDRGTLEIMVPLPEHEYFKSAIADLIAQLAEELGIEYERLGSTTWKHKGGMAGAQPDECFYIQNLDAIRGRLDIDLNTDPPPDLVLEIDITNKSLDRLPIYARLGVPEIWRYDKGELKIYHLVNMEYLGSSTSLAFGNFPVKDIPSFVQQNIMTGRAALKRAFSIWVRERVVS